MRILGSESANTEEILEPEALHFIYEMNAIFQPKVEQLLLERNARRERISKFGFRGNDSMNEEIRSASWQVADHPQALLDRRVEITGPTDAKMAINALNSKAKVWLADLEDANTPHWNNVINGQLVLKKIARHSLAFDDVKGKRYELDAPDSIAQTLVRPRGLHMLEKHVQVNDKPVVAAFFDAGLYLFHNHKVLMQNGKAPYFYLPKLESDDEAKLWNEYFTLAQSQLGMPYGSIRATVLIETITAAFRMEEILFELRDHVSGLNAGRWDYLFSIVKNFRDAGRDFLLPDRDQLTMNSPFMRAYAEELVHVCHKRGAMAIGGMAAYIPNKNNPEVNKTAIEKVKSDKIREANQGFDGSWVAHPGLVPVCQDVFDSVLEQKPNQMDKQTSEPSDLERTLIDIKAAGGTISRAGLNSNIDVSLRYLMVWLRGNGAVAINNMMEDAATVEISRSQIWQQVKNLVQFSDTDEVCTRDLVEEELQSAQQRLIDETALDSDVTQAVSLFREIALADDYPPFLTTQAYELID